MVSESEIKEKIAELTKNRDEMISEANKQIAYLNGSINALQALIFVEEETPEKFEDEE